MYEGDGRQCTSHSLRVNSSDTYLANVVTAETRRGSSSCPWLVRVSEGQTVNVTLLDFAAAQQNSGGGQQATCQIYARMYIGTSLETKIVCSGGRRQMPLHTHTGRQDIRFAVASERSTQQRFYFLIRVEGEHLA